MVVDQQRPSASRPRIFIRRSRSPHRGPRRPRRLARSSRVATASGRWRRNSPHLSSTAARWKRNVEEASTRSRRSSRCRGKRCSPRSNRLPTICVHSSTMRRHWPRSAPRSMPRRPRWGSIRRASPQDRRRSSKCCKRSGSTSRRGSATLARARAALSRHRAVLPRDGRRLAGGGVQDARGPARGNSRVLKDVPTSSADTRKAI